LKNAWKPEKKLLEIYEWTLMKFGKKRENKELIGQESWIAKIQSILRRSENEMIKLIKELEKDKKKLSELRIDKWQRKKGD